MYPHYDCRTCGNALKKERGCTNDGVYGVTYLGTDGEAWNGCPRRPILGDPEYYSRLFSYYRYAKNGILPSTGGLEDQSFRLITLFGIIDTMLNYCDEEKDRQERAKKG